MGRFSYLGIVLLILVLDVWTKWLVSTSVELHEAIPLIPHLVDIVHVRNTGAAFGIGADASSRLVPLVLTTGALAVFMVVVVYALRASATDRILQTGLHMIMGGAIGNLIDRFRWGYVVDFVDIYAGRFHWPAFNVADSAIFAGIALLLLDMRRAPAEDAVSAATSA